jgi:lysophospholipase L1-like esterase
MTTHRNLLALFAATFLGIAGCSNDPGSSSSSARSGSSAGSTTSSSVGSSGGAGGGMGSSAAGGSLASGGSQSSGGSSVAAGGTSSASTPAGGTAETGGRSGGGQAGTSKSTTGGATGGQSESARTGGTGGIAETGGTSRASSGGTTSGGTSTGGITGGTSSNGGGGATTSSASTSTGTQHWVGSWSASPYYDSGNPPPVSLAKSVLRQVTHVSLGGSQIRVQLSNLAGNGAVTISAVHIALCKATGAVDSSIDTATDKALAFSGSASVTIAQGKEVWSDPIDFALPAQGNLTITMAITSVPSQVSGHSGSRTTSYIQSNSTEVASASMGSAEKTDHWFYISGIDVMAPAAARCAVAIGDSITDGRGTDTNGNNRWTDILAARLHANAATADVGMQNQGIGATNLVGKSGTAAQARFARDVLGQSSVKYVIVYDGVNDIGGGASYASMKSAYDDLISQAHAKNLLIYGATILPFNGNSYYTAAHESVRQQVNTYIKSGVFDGVIDFDKELSDGGNPPKLQADYAKWSQQDWLHPGPGGYQKMGETPDLALFTK